MKETLVDEKPRVLGLGLGVLRLPLTAVVTAIRFYQLLISPLLGKRCRFYPTCSEYCVEALKAHGLFQGGLLALKRVFRCHPACEGGLDPVPPAADLSKRQAAW